VTSASVAVDGDVVGRIGTGLCVFVGVTSTDSDQPRLVDKMAGKLWNLRVFEDDGGVMNRSAADLAAEILVVSQFTLYGDTSRGRRPSWSAAAPPDVAEPIVDSLVGALRQLGGRVATGRFRAEMQVSLVNDGPVTVMLEL
jgi:D-aminoacyl-tRNA deacylase